MVNNQTEFDNKYPKEVKEIKLKRKEFTGQLVIEDYSELENLSLRDVKSVDQLILKNLTKLQECTIWDCNLKKLMIENCPKIRVLNVRQNLLTNLEFLKGLDSLEELEIDGNGEIDPEPECLPKDLKIFTCEGTKLKPFQKLVELAKQNPQELAKKFWNLQKKYNSLKKSLTSLAEVNSQELVGLKTEELIIEAKLRAEERQKKIEELSKLISSVKQEKVSVTQALAYEKTLDFLRVKSTFLNARRGTIEELKERYNELSKFISGKNTKFSIAGNMVSNIGRSASSTTIFGVIPNALGEFIKAGNEYSKIKFIAKSSEEFQILLKNEEELLELENAYDSLVSVSKTNVLDLKDKQIYGKRHLFNAECEISAILESKGIWEGKLLNSDAMETAIMVLSENLTRELEKEFNQQFEEFKNKLNFGKEYTELFIQEKEIRIKIQ